MKPVIRASLEAQSGSIKGIVVPDTVQVNISACNEIDTISTFSNSEGIFLLRGVPQGTYQLKLTPPSSSILSDTILENIVVELGISTMLDTIKLN